jgi:hypothetical protein
MSSKDIDIRPTIYDTLEIIIPGRMGVLECHTFTGHYDFCDTVYISRWNEAQILAN